MQSVLCFVRSYCFIVIELKYNRTDSHVTPSLAGPNCELTCAMNTEA